MRVLIFGAGASKRAGYPLASELLDRVGESARESSSIQFRDAWRAWESFREEDVPKELSLIAYNSNPEVVLSLPDLYHLAAESEDDHRTTTAIRTFLENGESSTEELEEYFDSGKREALSAARDSRARLLRALEWYFGARHHEDRLQPPRRDYLRHILDPLSDGDVIITLNWDTVAERTLAEAEKWNPTNGYGFERNLLLEGPLRQTSSPPPAFPSKSPVKILKLHGSFGWRRTGHGVYLDSTMLREFGFHFDGGRIQLRDSAEPESYEPDPPLIAYPSFLKRLDHPTVDRIWRDASEALARAESLKVWGYSLPVGDGAIRALLQTVSVRVRREELDVVVHDPCQRVLDRWTRLLGDGIQVRQESL